MATSAFLNDTFSSDENHQEELHDWEEEDHIDYGDHEIDEVLARWSKRPTVRNPVWQPVLNSKLCQRCGKTVYPFEKIDVGNLYHKGCFKCKVCGRQLTLKTFQRELHLDSSQLKEIYCDKHVPVLGKGQLDKDALAIRGAIDAQKRTVKVGNEI